MRTSALCTAVVTFVVVGHPPPAVAQVDQQRAQEYFKEAQALCERDGGRLVGRVDLCADGDRRQADTDDRDQPAGTGPGSPATTPVGLADAGVENANAQIILLESNARKRRAIEQEA